MTTRTIRSNGAVFLVFPKHSYPPRRVPLDHKLLIIYLRVLIRLLFAQYNKDYLQHLVTHRDDGPLVSPSDHQGLVKSLELACRLYRAVGHFTQYHSHIPIALNRPATLFFPALALFPGHIPAQLLSRSLLPNRLMSVPISASNIPALTASIPGIVCSKSNCFLYGCSALSTWSSISAICCSNHRICFCILSSTKRCRSLICPSSASAISSAFFFLNLTLASNAISSGDLSPSISAVIIFVAVTPLMSLTTQPSLYPQSSSTLCNRFFSPARYPANFLRYRVMTLRCLMSFGGIKLALNKPHRANSASHSLSSTSVFRPGTFLMCCALTTNTFRSLCSSVSY